MPLHADDLPADVRKRLGLPSAKSTKTTRKEEPGAVHVRCRYCGEEFRHTTGPRGYEQHQEKAGHNRFDCVL
jgi:hypothetical protein